MTWTHFILWYMDIYSHVTAYDFSSPFQGAISRLDME